MGESGYAISLWSASAGYSASMLTEDAKVDSSSTRQLLPSSVNISAEYPALPDHDSMNNPSLHVQRKKNPIMNTHQIKGTNLETVNNDTYLGINVGQDLTWYKHVDKVVLKGNQTLELMKQNVMTS